MKKRSTQNYLVIGTAHLGLDKNILRVIANTARHYDAQVVHVGPVATVDEINMWRRRELKLRTWEKKVSEKMRDMDADKQAVQEFIREELQALNKEVKTNPELRPKKEKLEEKLANIQDKLAVKWGEFHDTRDNLLSELSDIENLQDDRIKALLSVLEDVVFVCNKELCIPTELFRDMYIDSYMTLGKHLRITAMPANGDKISGQPITKRTFTALSETRSSHIIPHMTPNVRPFPRPGLNQAYNFWTTGALHSLDIPKKITDAYKGASRPSCVLVSVDTENGEFHAQRLRIKYVICRTSHRPMPHIMFDGEVLDCHGNRIELESDDKGQHQTDMHAPYTHRGVIATARALNVLHRPGTYIDGGDTGDMESVSPFNQKYPGRAENLRLIDDITSIRKMLEATCPPAFNWIKHKINLDSNHHEWLTKFIDSNPTLHGLCDWETIAKNYFNEWEWYIRAGGDDKFFQFGDLKIKHGDGEGSVGYAAEVYGNYLAGHHHIYHELGDAVFVGPGCKLGPKYLQNRATSWQNQLTTLTKFKEVACKHPKTILHTEATQKTRFAYRGQIYEVDWYKDSL
jgi:hypothetical protein